MIDAAIILGPTGVGKSSLGLKIASAVKGEIISVDSRQAYKHIKIGTAKPSAEEMKIVPHHMIDILELNEKNDAESFAHRVTQCIKEVQKKNKLPILVGGSGFYFKAITEGLFPVRLEEMDRKSFYESISKISTEELYERLRHVDMATYKRFNQNDRYRISRALEIYQLTGIPPSEHFKRQKKNAKSGLKFLKVGLNLPRAALYEKINERTLRMLKSGWIEEVKELIKNGADPRWPGLKTLGYPEVIFHIKGKLSFDELVKEISKLTRQYAKRQITWFKKERDVVWFNADDEELEEKVLALINEYFKLDS